MGGIGGFLYFSRSKVKGLEARAQFVFQLREDFGGLSLYCLE